MTAKTKKNAAETEATGKKATVKKTRTLKPVAAKVSAPTVDGNLRKLAASRIPSTFVKEHNAVWDHAAWLGFLAAIKEKGYDPIDPDRVGLILEDAKAKFLAKKS